MYPVHVWCSNQIWTVWVNIFRSHKLISLKGMEGKQGCCLSR